MSWEYNLANLATSEKDQVRYYIGDTESDFQLLQDEEIEFELSRHDSVLETAVACCDKLVAKLSKQVDNRLGPSSISASDLAEQFRKLSDTLKAQAQGLNPPIAPSVPDDVEITEGRDAIFTVGMTDN